MRPIRVVLSVFLLVALLSVMTAPAYSQEPEAASSKTPDPTQFEIAQDMGEVAIREAAKVKQDLQKRARSLFEREALGWDTGTVEYLYQGTLSLPSRVPQFTKKIIAESRVLGLVGSALILFFVLVVLYSLLGQVRALRWVERRASPVIRRIPEGYRPYLLSCVKVVVSALIPLLLAGVYSLINRMIDYPAPWFQLTGGLLILWAIGALCLHLLRELLTGNLFEATAVYGKTIFRHVRLILLYLIIGMGVFRAALVLGVGDDVLQLIRFVVAVSVTTILFFLLLRKNMFLSLLPDLPDGGYRRVTGFFRNYYGLLLGISYLAALAWCFGYVALSKLILTKVWFTLGVLLGITVAYHYIARGACRHTGRNPQARGRGGAVSSEVRKSAPALCHCVADHHCPAELARAVESTGVDHVLSIAQLGTTHVTPWLLVKAVVVLLAFVFASRLLQGYLDYKVYPAVGVDPWGLGMPSIRF